jgi:hypothetical protein
MSNPILLFVTVIFGMLSATAGAADKPSKQEVKICLQTINDMTGGKPPQSAVKLCQQGKLDAAIDKAMSGGG